MLHEQLEAEAEQRRRDERESGSSGSGSSVERTSAHGDLSGSGFQVRQVQAAPGEKPHTS